MNNLALRVRPGGLQRPAAVLPCVLGKTTTLGGNRMHRGHRCSGASKKPPFSEEASMFLVRVSAYAARCPRSLQMLPTRRSSVIRSTTTVVSAKRFMTSIRETLHTHRVPLYLTERSPRMSTQKFVKYAGHTTGPMRRLQRRPNPMPGIGSGRRSTTLSRRSFTAQMSPMRIVVGTSELTHVPSVPVAPGISLLVYPE